MRTGVLVIGAGGAGMYAAIAAARAGARVLLADRNMVGRGGATVMAQMTVAAALGEEEPDSVEAHLHDTVTAGRGLCDARLAELVCSEAPARMREMDAWGVGWARSGNRIRQVHAPGHGVKRCCYVDFLNTGPAVAGTLRKVVSREGAVQRISNLQITDLVCHDGEVVGVTAFDLESGEQVDVAAGAVVVASGGLTGLYARSSASGNMLGDGFALALRAGASLMDMEFVQFFPIGHLAPRLVGMDPIMWDPFRYKLGGRLLNGRHEEFIERYGESDAGEYRATRDLATFAICSEVAAGRGTPSGGAYLSFTHLPEAALREAFGPVIDRLLANGIDLTRSAVEVSPIAHYHMGGIRVDAGMASDLPGLFVAGEAVGGASGANRLSGNAISEALVFGEVAGRAAARHAARRAPRGSSRDGLKGGGDMPAAALDAVRQAAGGSAAAPTATVTQRMAELKRLMWQQVGPFRDREQLSRAGEWIRALRAEHEVSPVPPPRVFANELADWHDLRNASLVAQCIVEAALAREESRGAHQRLDHEQSRPELARSQILRLQDGRLEGSFGSRRAGGGP
jgi:succinate dehydrogenase/fumarate reductase flavoprotein subunit